MHCSVWDPGILQSGMKTWPSQNPLVLHTHDPTECVYKETLEIAGRREDSVRDNIILCVEEEKESLCLNGREIVCVCMCVCVCVCV